MFRNKKQYNDMNAENKNIKEEDKVFESLRARLKDYKEEPDERLWQNIEKQTNKARFGAIKTIVIGGIVVLVAVIAALWFAPQNTNNQNEKELSQTSNSISNTYATNYVDKQTKTTSTLPSTQSNINKTQENNALLPSAQTNNAVTNIETDKDSKTTNNNTSLSTNNITSTQNNIMSTDKSKIKSNNILINSNKSTTTSNNIKRVSEENSMASKSSEIETTIEEEKLFVPNAFQPNSTEDRLKVFKPAYKEVKNYHLQIFSRNGMQVFSSKDITLGWDGTIKGRLADQGTYVYFISYEDINGKYREQKGSLLLYR